MIPDNRFPVWPGEVLILEYMQPKELTAGKLAKKIKIPKKHIIDLVLGKRGVSVHVALAFSKFFKTTPDFWLNLQKTFDIFIACQEAQGKGYRQGVEAAAAYISQFNSSTNHEYRLDDCILGKFNMTKRKKPRKNKLRLK